MKYFFGFCVFSFSVLMYLLNNPTKEDVRTTAHDSRVLTSATSAMPAQIKHISPAEPSLQVFSSIANAQKNLTHTTKDVNERSHSSVSAEERENLFAATRQELKINAVNALMRTMSDKKLSDISISNFNKEAIDYEWGMAYEQKISVFFNQNPIFSNFSPDTIECRSRNCQIVISAADKDQLATISSSVIDAVYSSNNELTKNALYVIDEQTNTLRFYFGRNEEDDSIGTILQ